MHERKYLISIVDESSSGGARGGGGVQGCWHPSARHPAREKLICASKNGGTSAVSLVTVDFSKPSVSLRTCLDDPLRPLTIGLGDGEEIRRK